MCVVLVTLCTNRKLNRPSRPLQARTLTVGTYHEVAWEWGRRVRTGEAIRPARWLYCGRGFAEALETEALTGQPLWILSAGMGLIMADDVIPAYDLTLAGTSDNSIRHKIALRPFRAAEWWSCVKQVFSKGRSLPWLLEAYPGATIVLTLSAPYAELVGADLEHIAPPDLNRLRIIGLASNQSLPDRIKPLWMPYDDRLDGPDSLRAGTRSDFPQRAARHFIETILPTAPDAPPESHRDQIEASLSGMRRPVIPQRQRMSDEDILAVIAEEWDLAEGSTNRMLRILRDDKRIACEQKRFSELFKQARAVRS